jgi:hypothetical protein
MKPTFVKKNTSGGAAGLSWEAGEVKVLNPYLAEELVMLSPEDYEIVQEPESTVVEKETELSEEDAAILAGLAEHLNEVPPLLGKVFPTTAEKPKGSTRKSNKKTETPSVE